MSLYDRIFVEATFPRDRSREQEDREAAQRRLELEKSLGYTHGFEAYKRDAFRQDHHDSMQDARERRDQERFKRDQEERDRDDEGTKPWIGQRERRVTRRNPRRRPR